ncbi:MULTISPECIES: cupin domain-containing protein [unclassified Pseudofrankia]|uniref:cupin domain-containing protein n=1 Tax=unclassified Pseudofrankia TaxID=2994372 RepID=UPI0008DA985B|nr:MULTISPECIES: cupin domain-containing protein [unclassified Pseudofrankia]MDT3446722.1 cupin domain-containing protein [Pseudofrankia sp. BMG5.37]OHV57538.1 hypothetical protein BCD48_43035 [Pseudofrankia sp. BMG5.36]
MNVRRVLIGTSPGGESVVISDEVAPRSHDFVHTPGSGYAIVWDSPAELQLPFDGVDRSLEVDTFFPLPGETRFLAMTIPPDALSSSADFDAAAAAAEAAQYTPGAAAIFEADNPGMHATPTIDYSIVFDGEVWLALPSGEEVHLTRGDVVVLQGARHAWRNKSDRPATMYGVMIGAHK